jgi:hypothetical protein
MAHHFINRPRRKLPPPPHRNQAPIVAPEPVVVEAFVEVPAPVVEVPVLTVEDLTPAIAPVVTTVETVVETAVVESSVVVPVREEDLDPELAAIMAELDAEDALAESAPSKPWSAAMKKADLLAIAESRGLAVTEADTKNAILAALDATWTS